MRRTGVFMGGGLRFDGCAQFYHNRTGTERNIYATNRERGDAEPRRFTSLDADLRDYDWNGGKPGDLLGRHDCKVEPP